MESHELMALVKEMVAELRLMNAKLDYICTQGIFVKVDEDLSEN